jgi:hypothetical protein
MTARIAQVIAREGSAAPVRIRRVTPSPVTAEERRARRPSKYPGWTPVERECARPGCAQPFTPKAPGELYHSPECRRAVKGDPVVRPEHRRPRKTPQAPTRLNGDGQVERLCALRGCGEWFVPAYPRSAYHSPDCRRKATNEIKTRSLRGNASTTPSPLVSVRAHLLALWRDASEDPDCPQHLVDRLADLVAETPETWTTLPVVSPNGDHAD